MTALRKPVTNGPDFICIGMQKAGTRWLYDQLQFRPGFWIPPFKELHYFDNPFPGRRLLGLLKRHARKPDDVNARRTSSQSRPLDQRDAEFFDAVKAMLPPRARGAEGYETLFAPKGTDMSGDVTPSYSTLEDETIASIAKAFPKTRIVLLLREPVSRAWSHVGMLIENGHPKDLATDPGHLTKFLKRDGVIGRSYPSRIAERWRRHVGERLGIFFFDDIVARPDYAIRRVLLHLGADAEGGETKLPPEFNRKAAPKPKPSPEILAILEEHFREERQRSAEMFGGPALSWGKSPPAQ